MSKSRKKVPRSARKMEGRRPRKHELPKALRRLINRHSADIDLILKLRKQLGD